MREIEIEDFGQICEALGTVPDNDSMKDPECLVRGNFPEKQGFVPSEHCDPVPDK